MHDPILILDKVRKLTNTPEQGRIYRMDLTVRPGEAVAIYGMNRWERRTLLDLICAMDFPDEGRILFKGEEPAGRDEERLNRMRGRMGIVTHPPLFLNNVRIMENLRLPLRYHSKRGVREIDAILLELLKALDLEGLEDIIPSNFDPLTLGAASLARALSVSPDLLVVERPVESLGSQRARRLPDLWKKHVLASGGAALALTSDPQLAYSLTDRIAVFEEGETRGMENRNSFRALKEKKVTRWEDPKGINDQDP